MRKSSHFRAGGGLPSFPVLGEIAREAARLLRVMLDRTEDALDVWENEGGACED